MVGALRSLKFFSWPFAIVIGLLAFWFSSTAAFSLIGDELHKTVGSTAPATTYRAQRTMAPSARALENKALLSSALRLLPTAPLASAHSESVQAVTMIALVLRRGPSAASEQVASVSKGDTVTVNTKQGRWWKVTTGAGQEGWLFSSYLRSSAG